MIIAIAENNGYPDGPYMELARIEVRVDVCGHTVIYERWQTQEMIRVVMIKPE